MYHRTILKGLPLVLGASLAVGCHSAHKDEQAYPPDPLLMSKKPIEGNVVYPDTLLAAGSEPLAPGLPPSAYASGARPVHPQLAGPIPSPGPTVPAMTIPGHHGPVQAVPAVQSRLVPEAAPGGRKADGLYGHAPDYTWVQGVVDRHYNGQVSLRYCDAAVEDAHGGKVSLDDDPRLADFKDGDVVVIEGSLVADGNAAATPGCWRAYPKYRVYNVWLVQRGK
jgi:hypothetical protein